MFGGKLRFALSGIWANRRSRGGSRGVRDTSGHRRVPKELELAVWAQGRPGFSLPAQDPASGVLAGSAIWAPSPPPHPPSFPYTTSWPHWRAGLPPSQVATAAAQNGGNDTY